jgi:hypothetical protein
MALSGGAGWQAVQKVPRSFEIRELDFSDKRLAYRSQYCTCFNRPMLTHLQTSKASGSAQLPEQGGLFSRQLNASDKSGSAAENDRSSKCRIDNSPFIRNSSGRVVKKLEWPEEPVV